MNSKYFIAACAAVFVLTGCQDKTENESRNDKVTKVKVIRAANSRLSVSK